MIESLDETIKELLVEKVPLDSAEVDISFEVPNREWSGSISKPTINVYLHDIRENVEQRYNERITEREGGRVTKARLGRYIDLSYLITAWTNNPEDEHRLLWLVLATMMRHPIIPTEVLQGSLQNLNYLVHTKVAQPDSILRNAADVWTALDNQLKPVLPYVVTLALEPKIIEEASEVKGRFIRFFPPADNEAARDLVTRKVEIGTATNGNGAGVATQPAPTVASIRPTRLVQGRVRDSTSLNKPVQAEIILIEQGVSVRTDALGRYRFENVIERPQYTFIVVAPGYLTARQFITASATSFDLELEPEK